MQKATEHILGSVLCSPGCFSMFRGNALLSSNVLKTYTKKAKQPKEIVQYDQGILLNLSTGSNSSDIYTNKLVLQRVTTFNEGF